MQQSPDEPRTFTASPDLDARVTDLVIRLMILSLLLYWSVSLMRPFLPIFVWAVILAVALFPVYARLAARLGNRPRLAAALITLMALIVVIGPVGALSANLIETVHHLSDQIDAGTLRVPPPPLSVAGWPVIGEKVQAAWAMAATNAEAAIAYYTPALRPFGQRLLSLISGVGGDVLRFVLAVILMGFLFGPGQRLASGGRLMAGRIIEPRGAQFVDMAGATIRNVSRGVVGLAVLQAILAGVVLQVAGVPGAGLLAFLILIFALIQIGPMPVVLPVIIWAWMTMGTVPALLMTVIMILISVMDNVLKPILMARGLTTPTLVIFLGVIGGTISYGLIGLFLGPIVLAVFYDLVVTWAQHGRHAAPLDSAPRPDADPSQPP